MNLLPEEIIPTVLCYTVCNAHGDEELSSGHRSADIAICNANGYLLEFSNKKIINSCYIPIDDAAKLQVYYQFTSGSYAVYYLLKNENGVMVIVKKWKDTLVVMKCYNNIRFWKVFDFKNRGYPQLGLYYFDSDTVHIINLSEFDSFKLGVDNHFAIDKKDINNSRNFSLFTAEEDDLKELLAETDEEMPSENQNESIIDYLTKQLLAMEQYNNELMFEVYKMNGLLRRSCNKKCQSSVMTNKSLEVCHIKFTNYWTRIHLGYWILGVEFWCSGVRDVNKIKLTTLGRDFTSCIHRLFTLSDKSQSDMEIVPLKEGGEGNVEGPKRSDHFPEMDFITVKTEKEEIKAPSGFPIRSKYISVVAFRVPDFEQKTSLSVVLSFLYGGHQFRAGSFHLRPEHFFQEKYQVFQQKNEMSLSEDLMSCLVVRKEIGLTVEMKYELGITLENVLTERLGFTKTEITGENYFIKESGDLTGTCVSVERMSIDPVSWNLRVSVTNLAILRIFIGVLYNELPMPVKIQLA